MIQRACSPTSATSAALTRRKTLLRPTASHRLTDASWGVWPPQTKNCPLKQLGLGLKFFRSFNLINLANKAGHEFRTFSSQQRFAKPSFQNVVVEATSSSVNAHMALTIKANCIGLMLHNMQVRPTDERLSRKPYWPFRLNYFWHPEA
eukprot:99013-Amphidinium_carterae.1